MNKKNNNYEKVSQEVVSNYNNWLKFSKLTHEELLKFSKYKEFKLIKNVDNNGIYSVSMFTSINGQTKTIGSPLVSPSVKDNEMFKINCSFLLLYITQRLDENNRKEYFYKKALLFIKNELGL